MAKVLVISNDGMADGYGRISMSTNIGLVKRGYQVLVASLTYDGLLPAQFDGQPLPYHVASLQGKEWVSASVAVINAFQPDVVVCTQDMPYLQAIRNAPLDWSKFAFVGITPVDGAPLYAPWIETAKQADAMLTISQFGVDAYRKAGVTVGLCRPGVNLDKFYRMTDEQRADIRKRLGIEQDAFVLGTAAQNQGRKSIPAMIDGFNRFALDKPTARYILDMEDVSPAGWDIPSLCKQFGWDRSKLIFRADAVRLGVTDLRERYNAMDAHAVISHREGWGLPLTEAQACGVVSMAMDYCSGAEICGNGNGVLIKPVDYTSVSTWGGALDYHPDVQDFADKLQWLHDNPDERRAIARRGMEESRKHTWDAATDAVQGAIEQALSKRRKSVPIVAQIQPTIAPVTAAPQSQPDGVAPIELVEKVV
jgi:glycosyltransferase involved in cell wall biosynthesis